MEAVSQIELSSTQILEQLGQQLLRWHEKMKFYDCGIALFLVIVGAILVANMMTDIIHENHQPKARKVVIQVERKVI
jgi:hypothetical protein